MQSKTGIDIHILDTGRYYVTNSSNLPPEWIAAYLDVERLDSQWCRITAWPPYEGTDAPYITKQCGGAWQGWEYLITNADRGITTPLSGYGTYNADWVTNHLDCIYRVVNGICFVRFDMDVKPISTDGTILIRGLPIATFPAIYQCGSWMSRVPTGVPLIVDFYGNITAFTCPGGYIAGYISYPVK